MIDQSHQRRPDAHEYAEFYAGYIAKVADGNFFDQLANQVSELEHILRDVSNDRASRIDPPYGWTIKQVISHLIDGEKIFGYRLHRFACGDDQELPGFDENAFVDALEFETVSLNDLVDELITLRQANILFLKRIPPSYWDRKGIASKCSVTVRALSYISVGHIRHHLEIIRKRLKQQ